MPIIALALRHLMSFVVANAFANILRTFVTPAVNPILNAIIKIGCAVTAYVAAGSLMKPLSRQLDEEVESIKIFSKKNS